MGTFSVKIEIGPIDGARADTLSSLLSLLSSLPLAFASQKMGTFSVKIEIGPMDGARADTHSSLLSLLSSPPLAFASQK